MSSEAGPIPAMPLLLAALGYAIGIFNPAHHLVRRLRGHDIRSHGSGNAGATNAGRLLGWRGFAMVFALDAAKGAIPVYAARWASGEPLAAYAALAGAILGHVWPVHLGFRGGKGVSTLLGGLLALDPWTPLVLGGVCLPFLAIFRRFVPSGLLALAATPLILHFRHAGSAEVLAAGLLVSIVWFAHRAQIRAEFDRLAGRGMSRGDGPATPP